MDLQDFFPWNRNTGATDPNRISGTFGAQVQQSAWIATRKPMTGSRFARLRAVLLLTAYLSAPVSAAEIALDPDEQRWVTNHPTVRIAPDPDFAPIEFIDPDGQYQGIAADYLELVQARLPVNFEVVALSSWDEVLVQARERDVDMFGAATASPQREEYMAFTVPHIRLPGVIITRNDSSRELTLEQLSEKSVAAVSGYVWFDLIGNQHPGFALQSSSSLTQALRDLSFGNYDAVVSDPATATQVIRKEGLTNLQISGDTGFFTELAFGVRKDWPELVTLLNKAIATISEAEREAILDKWVSLEQPGIDRGIWYAIAGLALLVLLVTVGTLAWNRVLSQRVAHRTHELDAAQSELLAINVDLEKRVRERTRRLQKAINELKASQSQLVQSEKMASMGQLVAGVAHEINTPLGYVHNNVQLLEEFVARMGEYTSACKLLTDLMASPTASDDLVSHQFEIVRELTSNLVESNEISETRELVKDSGYGLTQITDIVHGLKDFSRVDRAMVDEVALNANIENALKVVNHLARDSVTFVRKLGDIPPVRCNPSQINQVLVNVLTNSCHAIEEKGEPGRVEIRTEADENYVHVTITDDGVGMPKGVGDRIFEPFYTTKKAGQGTGLGLSISYNILKQHNAKLKISSRSGKGTLFRFGIPLRPEKDTRRRNRQDREIA